MEEKIEQKIEPGKFVKYTYKVSDDSNGRVLFEAPAEAPDVMVYGVSNEVIPGLVAVMKGLKAGDKFSVTLPPEVAFGERSDDNVITVPAEAFMRDGKMAEEVKVGAALPMLTEQGYTVTGVVKAINEHDVTMDFNHPFAGITVKFDGEVQEVRDATPEELQPVSSCGCGCSHGGCDDGCGGGCGDHDHDHDHGCCGGCH
ncbi:MAG: FKBP-type peptidyl-prolyl cis-trans isomerase [Muribaculaceae bacterium]|nr:FKBP-type peptidyl-prolyl cis-trans isomerase [Muribaculaceae bacterium]